MATWSCPTKRKVGRAGEKTGEAFLVRIAPGMIIMVRRQRRKDIVFGQQAQNFNILKY